MYIEWKSKATTFYKRFGFGAFGHRPPKKKEKEKAVANVEDMKKKKKKNYGRAIRVKWCSSSFIISAVQNDI